MLVDHRHRMFEEIGGFALRALKEHDRAYRKWLGPRLRSGELVMLLVEGDGQKIIASGGIWFRAEQPRPRIPQLTVPYILSMYTEPEYRGQGQAGRIVREALRICRRAGYTRVILHAARKARRLYRRFGFERTWEMRISFPRPAVRVEVEPVPPIPHGRAAMRISTHRPGRRKQR